MFGEFEAVSTYFLNQTLTLFILTKNYVNRQQKICFEASQQTINITRQ